MIRVLAAFSYVLSAVCTKAACQVVPSLAIPLAAGLCGGCRSKRQLEQASAAHAWPSLYLPRHSYPSDF